jgi:CheY-like chemotaxis protein
VSTSAGCPILIVEDDPDLRYMMVQMLALEGFEPEGASDGVEALKRLRSPGPRPHVIVLDMMMPRMDGWEFCRVRALDPDIGQIPVVVLSAAPRHILDIDAAAVISKPFDYDTLLEAVRREC